MIVRQVRGNIFTSGRRHIAFGVNAQGALGGFAEMVAQRYWQDLQYMGLQPLGTTLSHYAGDYIFHALVCHHNAPGGFAPTPAAITVCLDAIPAPDDVEIACVLVGSGPAGQAAGADTQAILRGIQASRKQVIVYSL